MTLLPPHSRHYLGLGLLGDHVEPGGAHLHVVNVGDLRADRLGDGVALLSVPDDDPAGEVLLVTVGGEGGDTHVLAPLHVLHPALGRLSLEAGHGLLSVLTRLLVDLVVDEGSRAAVGLPTLVGPATTQTGAVVALSLTAQREGADHENLEDIKHWSWTDATHPW